MALVDYDELESDEDTGLVKKLRAKIDEQAKLLKELEAQNTEFMTQTRKRSLAEMLEKRGYAGKIAAFIPSDLELSDESLDSWLTEYGDAFTPVQAAPPSGDEERRTVVVNNAAEAESLRRMQAAEGSAAPAVSSNDVLQRINSASNMDELVAALRGGS